MDKRFYIIIGSFFVFVLVILGVWAMSQPSVVKTGVEFVIVPDKVTVSGGEKELTVNYGSIVKFAPGEHTLQFSADGFTSDSKKVTVTENQITQVFVLLEPQTDEARAIINRAEMGVRIERIAGNMIIEGGQELSEQYPFINSLPIIDKFFSIKTCTNSANEIEICIRLTIDNQYQKDRALAALKEAGVDTKKFKPNFVSSLDPH